MNQEKETLTSRERVIRALNHQPVDRLPIDLGVHDSTGISAFAYWNLREYLGLDTALIEVSDMVQFLAQVDEDIRKRFHLDCRRLTIPWLKTQRWNPRGKYVFTIPATAQPESLEGGYLIKRGDIRIHMPANGFFFDGGWPTFDERDPETEFQATVVEAERIYKETNYATMLMAFGAYFSREVDWLCDAMLEPEKIMAANSAECDRNIAHMGKIIDHMGEYIQCIAINADMGTQASPFASPALVEQVTAPFLKRFCSFVHENSNIKVFLHSCGSIEPLIPILIEAGIDVLNPVQISANNMNPQNLVDKYGGKIVFWGGGCDTQHVLGVATPAKVAENVRESVGIFKRTSGYVFNQVHNIMGDVPPENIIAMLETAYKESFY